MMTGYSSSKVAVKDSFDDDEASDDVEDEVFIRDGRNGFKVDEEMGVKRPLMAPRRKYKSTFLPETSKRPFCKRICVPYCYGMIAVALIIGFVMGATIFLNLFPSPLYNFRLWPIGTRKDELSVVPCSDFAGTDIWYKTFPWLKSEVALVLVDVNQDGVDDVIMGYSTDQEAGSCDIFPNAKEVCGGGVLALDGTTGETLWQHWTRKDVLFVDCSADINADKTKDCLISGKGGVLSIINGKTGTFIWDGTSVAHSDVMDLYAAQYISDLNGDGSPDVLLAHTLSQSGQLAVLSGRTGKALGHLNYPDKEGLYTMPRVTVSKDGSDIVLFATGSSETSGALYAIRLLNIAITGTKYCSNVWKSDIGMTTGIVLADMNGDGTEDIIISSGDTLTVLDGNNYTPLWNVSSSGLDTNQKQILIGPTPAYFDDDLVPDLLITHMVGPSFPTIYYSQTWVANGKDGVGLLEEPIIGGSDVTGPGVTISFTGIGNDMYLFWMSTCNSIAQKNKPFLFSKQSDLHENTRADLCRLRFNKSLEMQMYILNQHIEPPGVLLYSSKLKWEIEHNVTEHKINKKVLPKPPQHPSRNRGRLDKYEKLRKSQLDKIYQEVPKNYPMYDGDDRNIMNVLPRFQDSIDVPEAREPLSNIMPPLGINIGELPDYDPAYPQELESEDILPRRMNSRREDIYEGRNERDDPADQPDKEKEAKNGGYSDGKREKRKAGDHSNGLPRALTTAALAKPISNSGIDILFATHWVMPANNVRILTDRDQRCIRKRLSKEQSNNLNDLDRIEEMAENECLGGRPNGEGYGEDYAEGVESQLTVYRINLNCKCSDINPSREKCSEPLPLEQQSYSHRATNVYFKRRHRPNLQT